MINMCMHCLDEGDWEDEDACPKCRLEGHVSPWQVSQCPACNKQFFDSMKELKDRINKRIENERTSNGVSNEATRCPQVSGGANKESDARCCHGGTMGESSIKFYGPCSG